MNNSEFNKLKNTLALKSIFKIILYTVAPIIIFEILADMVYNDDIANFVSGLNRNFYVWCVHNKGILTGAIWFLIFFVAAFVVNRSLNDNLVEIISAMDKILKEPEKDIELSDDLLIFQNRLNTIRVDLITSKNKAAEEAQKKDDLIMYMAHDLKTPLTSVIGYLTLLTEENKISKEMREKYLKIVLDKALRLEELTNEFFDITRYNLHDISITKNNIDLSFLIDQLIDEFYPMLKTKNLEFKINKPEHIPFLGDGNKLARAFGNLIKNAINYSYENTEIEIDVTQNDNKTILCFKNKGDKIPEYKLPKIFDKFYRVDESRSTSTGGTGLGLAITKEIIDLHEGTITVKNDDEFIEFCVEL